MYCDAWVGKQTDWASVPITLYIMSILLGNKLVDWLCIMCVLIRSSNTHFIRVTRSYWVPKIIVAKVESLSVILLYSTLLIPALWLLHGTLWHVKIQALSLLVSFGASVASGFDTKYDDQEKVSYRAGKIDLRRVIYRCLYFHLLLNIS